MPAPLAEAIALLLLAGTLAFAIVRPRGRAARLGPATRFVVDHAPSQVLLLWPDEVPALGSIPPPPDHPHGPGHPPPPPHER